MCISVCICAGLAHWAILVRGRKAAYAQHMLAHQWFLVRLHARIFCAWRTHTHRMQVSPLTTLAPEGLSYGIEGETALQKKHLLCAPGLHLDWNSAHLKEPSESELYFGAAQRPVCSVTI